MFFMKEYRPNSHPRSYSIQIFMFIYYISWPRARSRSRNFDIPASAPAPWGSGSSSTTLLNRKSDMLSSYKVSKGFKLKLMLDGRARQQGHFIVSGHWSLSPQSCYFGVFLRRGHVAFLSETLSFWDQCCASRICKDPYYFPGVRIHSRVSRIRTGYGSISYSNERNKNN